MSDSQTGRAELREQQAAARAAHVAGQFDLPAGQRGRPGGLAGLVQQPDSGAVDPLLGDIAALFAMVMGTLLMWLAEHTRST
jgi:hypothetical protein